MQDNGLHTIWSSNRSFFEGKGVQQILSMSGDGELKDGNATSVEFRNFLTLVPSSMLAAFAGICLDKAFTNSGLVLQDVMNEIGSRLGFSISPGRYRGIAGAVGFDGLWRARDGHQLLVEVKTTDAYRINLDVIAGYRQQLIDAKTLSPNASSILIIVGRQDTGDLEAQIRGSRYAWDTRLISVEALLRLIVIKESLETPLVTAKIVEVLKPREYTRVDPIIDLIFDTSREVQIEPSGNDGTLLTAPVKPSDVSPEINVADLRTAAVERTARHLGCSLVQQSRSIFGTTDRQSYVACLASKRYLRGSGHWYWFTVRQSHLEYLRDATKSWFCFACGSVDRIILIPTESFAGLLKEMRSKDDDNWQVEIDWAEGKVMLNQPRADLTKYVIT